MLTVKEEKFIEYWRNNRLRQKNLLYQFAVGLPVGFFIGGLIVVNFYSGWYKRAEMIANSGFPIGVLLVAVVAIAVFFAIFSKKFQWDQYELRYNELLFKLQKNSLSNEAAIQTKEASLVQEVVPVVANQKVNNN